MYLFSSVEPDLRPAMDNRFYHEYPNVGAYLWEYNRLSDRGLVRAQDWFPPFRPTPCPRYRFERRGAKRLCLRAVQIRLWGGNSE